VSLPSLAEVEHADWPTLQRICADLDLNPKGRSGLVRTRVLDHVRRRMRAPPWRAAPEHQAALLTRLGFPDAATGLWERVIRLDAPAPWVGYGAARLAAGEVEEATKAFDRAAQMRDAVAHLHRAEALGARGDLVGAIRSCDAYLEGNLADLRALALKAGFLSRGGWLDESIAVLEFATEAHPGVSDLWRGLGVMLLKARRTKPAADALRKAAKLDASDVPGRLNLGSALLLSGRPKDAIGSYREALELDPSHVEALNNLGVAYLSMGQLKSALVNLERAAKHVEAPAILLNLAKTEEIAKRRREALKAYERILRIRPKDARAKAGRKRLAGRPKPSARTTKARKRTPRRRRKTTSTRDASRKRRKPRKSQ